MVGSLSIQSRSEIQLLRYIFMGLKTSFGQICEWKSKRKMRLANSDWFVFRVAKGQRMKEYTAIPRNQLQKDDINIIAEIVIVNSCHQLSFWLSMSCKNHWSLLSVSWVFTFVNGFTCYKTSCMNERWWNEPIGQFLAVRSSNIDWHRWYRIQIVDGKMRNATSTLIDDDAIWVWFQVPLCMVRLPNESCITIDSFTVIWFLRCTHNIRSDVDVNFGNVCSWTRRKQMCPIDAFEGPVGIDAVVGISMQNGWFNNQS